MKDIKHPHDPSQTPDALESASAEEKEFLQAALGFYRTVKTLRGPQGCPWDKEQTFSSLRPFMVEEAYEAVAAAEKFESARDSVMGFCDELGDVLLQVFLNAQIAADENLFAARDVFASIDAKMIRRHPHVFGEKKSQVESAEDVVKQWSAIKEEEKATSVTPSSLMDKALKKRMLPTLSFACEVSKRSKRLGFAWPDLLGTFSDLESEVQELKHELMQEQPEWEKVIDEMGDIVYALANVLTFLKETEPSCAQWDLDLAARAGIEKFITRFQEMEKIQREKGELLTEEKARSLDLESWNELWKQAKARRYR